MSPFCPKTGQPTTKEAYDEFHRQMKNMEKHNTKSLELIPFLEITDKAREIAVVWIENYTPYGSTQPEIAQKHKLASDIMNYAKEENAALTQQVEELTKKIELLNIRDSKREKKFELINKENGGLHARVEELTADNKNLRTALDALDKVRVNKSTEIFELKSELEELKKERAMIPIKDRLPDEDVNFLFYCSGDYIEGYYCSVDKVFKPEIDSIGHMVNDILIIEPSHWTHLPPNPKESAALNSPAKQGE